MGAEVYHNLKNLIKDKYGESATHSICIAARGASSAVGRHQPLLQADTA